MDDLQGSVTTIIQHMNKDQSSKEELKEQVVDLTAYIQQWAYTKEETTTKLSALALLSKEKINKMEKIKNWTKSTMDWFNMVVYNGDMGIHHTAMVFNKFQSLQK